MSFATFVSDMTGLVVTGVRKRFDATPAQLSSAVLPAQYPRLAEVGGGVVSLTGSPGLFSGVCELVIVVKSVLQDNNTPNFDATVTLMSALDAALQTSAAAGSGIDRWAIRQDVEPIGDTNYWIIVARIEASG